MRIWAEIDTQALKHNLAKVKSLAPSSQVIAMIKTNAYGHGLLICANALDQADYFGVATIEECISLRENGSLKPILLMSGVQSADELDLLKRYQIDSIVYDSFQLEILKNAPQNEEVNIWLKFDSGMHRLGFASNEAHAAIETAESLKNVNIKALMTHLASADLEGYQHIAHQIESFAVLTSLHQYPQSIANSSAVLKYPELFHDYIRPGMMLYGVNPLASGKGEDHGLIPVMTLKARVMRVFDVLPGDTVGYGATWVAPFKGRIAVVSAGYGDGYPRQPGDAIALLNSIGVNLVGRVSMDYLTLDVTDVDEVKISDEVILWGKGLPIEQIAAAAKTSPYALLSNLSHRVLRKKV